jgi:prepilin-type N-terminal cleavage/methylation domain-containing protein
MRKGKGWSLLELLTVIAIIAILVAILFPVFARAKEAAKKATCLSNISQLAKAMRLYSLDYNEYMYFERGRASTNPLAGGHYGNGYYLKKIMKNYCPHWGIWFCPSDNYAQKDWTCSSETFGSFNYTASGLGYKELRHRDDTDNGIVKLYSELVRLYGKDDMKMEHNELSYRIYPNQRSPCDGPVVYIDNVVRCYRGNWGAYGYWDINPSSAEIFQEDISYHFTGVGGIFGKIYGKTYGFRDGHAVFHTYENHGVNNYGELNEGW